MQPEAPQRHWSMRVAARLYVAAVLVLCVVAALALVRGQLPQAAVAMATLFADFVGLGALIAGIVACVFVGAPLAALVATAILGTRLAGRAGARLEAKRLGPQFDLEALAAATAFPEDLRRQLGEVADGPITTRTMLAAARAADTRRWAPVLGEDPGAGMFDGPLIVAADGVECSQFAAEALGFARVLGERLHRPLGIDLLAACGGLIPSAAAGEWLADDADRGDLVRASPEQLAAAMLVLAETPPGADLLRRFEDVSRPGRAAAR